MTHRPRTRRFGSRDERDVVLFYRNFHGFTGGHLKVWDYFQHVASSPKHRPLIRLSLSSVRDASNPWSGCPDAVVRRPGRPGVVFLAGRDWESIAPRQRERPTVPVINLIQHVRHCEPGDPRQPMLRYPAVRIGVSPEVTEAITSTGIVRGPVFTIPNGLDLERLSTAQDVGQRTVDLVVVGIKRPELAVRLGQELAGDAGTVRVLTDKVPRSEFLSCLGSARVALLLPNPTEGFYLPALEAMALGTIVVCPDCVGNRSFCIDGVTAWRPPYESEALLAATRAALRATPAALESQRRAAHEMAGRHNLAEERRAFLEILDHLPELWRRAAAG